ncbi:PGG domain - like 1, partial [Theobroma cacao]
MERDSPSDTRNVLLVVAALIASVTFQEGLNPPSGLLEYDSQSNPASGNVTRAGPAVTSAFVAASALLGTQATSYLFLFWNSFGLTASLSIIIYLTGGFPFQRELLISMLSMMFSYGFSIYGRDSPSDVRNILLIVATLIAAVTFQAGVNPPGGVWQDNGNGHYAGRAIYASQTVPFYVFLISNTLALSASVLVIISLTYRFPFHLEVIVATISMIVTYASAVFAVTPREFLKFRYVMAAAAVPFAI